MGSIPRPNSCQFDLICLSQSYAICKRSMMAACQVCGWIKSEDTNFSCKIIFLQFFLISLVYLRKTRKVIMLSRHFPSAKFDSENIFGTPAQSRCSFLLGCCDQLDTIPALMEGCRKVILNDVCECWIFYWAFYAQFSKSIYSLQNLSFYDCEN